MTDFSNGRFRIRITAVNSRLPQWRMTWLIEHSISPQLLWRINSFVLRKPPSLSRYFWKRKAQNRCGYLRGNSQEENISSKV